MLNSLNLRFIIFLAIIGFFVASCEKENDVTIISESATSNENVCLDGRLNVTSADDCSIYRVNEINPNQLKGFRPDPEDYIETSIAYQSGSTEQYKTMKIYRDPYNPATSDYFYIMLENLRYAASNSWAYNNDGTLVSQYGRLYTWQAAYDSRTQVYMRFPKTINGVTRYVIKTGNLPSIADIADLLELSGVPSMPNSTTTFNGNTNAWDCYYDVFVSGKKETTINFADANHTLAGWLNNTSYSRPLDFDEINQYGMYWTSEASSAGFHYPFQIQSSATSYSSFINVGYANTYGFSVRYVFYPN